MENIARLMKELPKEYEHKCYAEGAIVRKRRVSNPSDLMMLAMFHLQNGCSLLEISEVARITKLGNMSGVAFMKRFEKCGNWFRNINEQLASESLADYKKPSCPKDKAVIATEGSEVSEKGRSGRVYRLHFSLDIFKMISVEHKITTNKTGESLCNFTPKPGQLFIADRAYSNIKGIKHCAEHGAEYIARLRRNSFTIKDGDGKKIDLLSFFEKIGTDECADFSVFATNTDGEKIPIRICAKRKSPEAVKQTRKKLKQKESKKQCVFSEETKNFNEYIVVVANLDDSISAKEILDLYLLHRQAELYFKRLKSILDFGELPKRREESIFAWLNGKIMAALLIEIMLAKVSFSPQEQNKLKHLARN